MEIESVKVTTLLNEAHFAYVETNNVRTEYNL